ncbi:MAG: sulfite exporter TauE/SafE family protein [Bryobacterales bacterium]|nr:sulfite exporter TauE/SafE family protein [Bryobacterales bacterium]
MALLGGAAALAGAINSIAGGGTLVTFPTLLSVLSAVPANATSTFALLPGSFASAWGYRDELAASRTMLKRLFLPSLFGGIVGALALTRFPESVFETLVPWLLLGATVLMLVQKPLARWIGAHPHETPRGSTVAAVVFFQFLVGVYGGYFGAGIGILMLSSLGFMGIADIHQMNGIKSILASVMNGIGALIFVIEGKVVWQFAIPMALASIAGGYVGARLARKLPASAVRAIVIAMGFIVAGYAFYRQSQH